MTGEEDRLAMLAGRDLDALDEDERTQLESWAALLADQDLWAEPAPDLEDIVVASIAAAPAPARGGWARTANRRISWTRPLLAGLAAAAAIVVGLVLFTGRDPDRVAEFSLAGQDLAPTATGRADVFDDPAGFRIELEADGLPELEGRQFYQAWLKGEDGSLPIGTFSKADGSTITLWSAISPEIYPTLTVTIEEPGDQESSGQLVLLGSVGD